MTEQRIYLVVVDDSAEAEAALRFAARRAVHTGGMVHVLALLPPPDFLAFGAIAATMAAEARERAELLAAAAANSVARDAALNPLIAIAEGDPVRCVQRHLADHPDVAALVLGARADGPQTPLVAHFAREAGRLPCVLMIVPGALAGERLDLFS